MKYLVLFLFLYSVVLEVRAEEYVKSVNNIKNVDSFAKWKKAIFSRGFVEIYSEEQKSLWISLYQDKNKNLVLFFKSIETDKPIDYNVSVTRKGRAVNEASVNLDKLPVYYRIIRNGKNVFLGDIYRFEDKLIKDDIIKVKIKSQNSNDIDYSKKIILE